jgi:hypothetical protein
MDWTNTEHHMVTSSATNVAEAGWRNRQYS